MNNTHIEPGVLQIFRRFMMVVWILLCLGLLDASSSDYYTVLSWGYTSLLLIYLYRPPFRQHLGVGFLPLALLYIATMPIFGIYLATFFNMASGFPPEFALVDPGILYLWLLLPLLLISTQYRMRVMFFFTFGTAIQGMVLALPLMWMGGPSLELTWEPTFVRILLFSTVGYVVVRITQAQREQRVALAEKNTELTHYATTLEQLAITRERNRMARELHDTLAHTLSAVNIQLKALEVLIDSDPDSAKNTLQQTQQLTRDGLHEARRALHALRSSPLEEFGCVLAIQQIAKAKAERAGIALELDLPVQITNVSPMIEQNLFRIVEEAINNVIHHAEASNLSIRLYQDDKCAYPPCLQLYIQDDGAGFDMKLVNRYGHYGLVGMSERARLISGDLKVHSDVGQGTTIELKIGQSV